MQYAQLRSYRLYLLILLLSSLAEYSLAQAMDAAAASSSIKSTNAEVLIGSGDLLEISVYGAPDFNKLNVRVDSSGMISLPLIGTEKVAGLNVRAAEQLTAKRLSEGGFFSDPLVSIFEKEYATQGISVLGEVQKL